MCIIDRYFIAGSSSPYWYTKTIDYLGDANYLGVILNPEKMCIRDRSSIDYRINRRPGKLPHVSDNAIDWERYVENRKSSVRCKACLLYTSRCV